MIIIVSEAIIFACIISSLYCDLLNFLILSFISLIYFRNCKYEMETFNFLLQHYYKLESVYKVHNFETGNSVAKVLVIKQNIMWLPHRSKPFLEEGTASTATPTHISISLLTSAFIILLFLLWAPVSFYVQ